MCSEHVFVYPARPIAAPLQRCAELLGVDLATITAAATRVQPYVRVDGTKVWSLMQLERQLRPQAYGRVRGGYIARRRIRVSTPEWHCRRGCCRCSCQPSIQAGGAALEVHHRTGRVRVIPSTAWTWLASPAWRRLHRPARAWSPCARRCWRSTTSTPPPSDRHPRDSPGPASGRGHPPPAAARDRPIVLVFTGPGGGPGQRRTGGRPSCSRRGLGGRCISCAIRPSPMPLRTALTFRCCWPGPGTPRCVPWSAMAARDPKRLPATSPSAIQHDADPELIPAG
jgi:hypothetical protein